MAVVGVDVLTEIVIGRSAVAAAMRRANLKDLARLKSLMEHGLT